MRQIKQDGRLPQEKMTSLAAILFLPAFIVFVLFFKSISDWRADIQEENNFAEIESFIVSVYKPLGNSRSELRKQLLKMQTLIKKIEKMELTHPNHIELIHFVKKQWSLGHASLYKAYTETDREVRRAWIAHNTMDKKDVLFKFSKQAVQIEAEIQIAQSDYEAHIYGIQDEMIKIIDQARKLLDAKRTPPISKKQISINQTLSEKIKPISSSMTTELLTFLTTLDHRLEDDVNIIHELIRMAAQQSALTRDLLYKNRDLEQPLTKIIRDWKTLEEKTNEDLDQIYYAIEAEYVVRQLGLSVNSPAIKAMHQTLFKVIPLVKGEGSKQKRIIDHSYSININR